MQIRELSQPVTSKKLNESIAKKFGYKINLEQFSDVQLEDARNKLRTKISQFEMNESFDSVLESPQYQKTRMFLDCINQEIMEREETEKCDDCGNAVEKCDCDDHDHDHKEHNKVEENTAYASFIKNRASKFSVPESWINSAIQRIQLGESDREELKAELQLRYDLNESQASWMLLEGEEDKAEIIMATKDMVDRITGWLEDTAAMKAEQLLELMDSIRAQQGSDVAQRYQDAVKPALEAIYTALETSRQGLSSALAVVSGGEAPMMGAPVGGEMGGMDQAASGLEGELGAAELPALGGEVGATPPAPEAGREKRESVDYSRRLGLLLNSKKK
jgi:hypothetical protein